MSTYINIRAIRVISGQKNEFESAYSQSLRRERKKQELRVSAPLRSIERVSELAKLSSDHTLTLKIRRDFRLTEGK